MITMGLKPDEDSESRKLPAISQESTSHSLPAWDEAPSRKNPARHIPYLNGLAHTCRRAFEESSDVLFHEHSFTFDD